MRVYALGNCDAPFWGFQSSLFGPSPPALFARTDGAKLCHRMVTTVTDYNSHRETLCFSAIF